MGPVKFLSLRARFMLAPVVGVLLTVVFLVASERTMQSERQLLKRLSNANLPLVGEINRTITSMVDLHMQLSSMLHQAIEHQDEETVYVEGRLLLNSLHDHEQTLRQRFAIYQDPETEALLGDLLIRFTKYRGSAISAIELSTVDPERALIELSVAEEGLHHLNLTLQHQVEQQINELSSADALIKETLDSGYTTTLLAVALASAMVFLAVYFSGRLTRDIHSLNKQLIRLGKGQTDIQLEQQSDPYLNPLLEAVEKFRQTLLENEWQQGELKHAIAELEDSKLRSNTILDLVPTAIVAVDMQNRIALFNRAAEKLFGYDQGIVGKELDLLLPQSLRDSHKLRLQGFGDSHVQDVQMGREPIKAKRSDGVEFFMEASLAKMELADQTLVAAAISDITGRLKAEQALKNSESRLRTLIDTIPDLVWLKDRDGVYLGCNKKFEQYLGACEADILGKTDFDFMEEAEASIIQEKDQQAIVLRQATTAEEQVTFAVDGHAEILETIKTPMFDSQGNPIGILGVSRDITLRKRQEERILEQAHFDSLTSLPNRFLSLERLSQLLIQAKEQQHKVAVLFLDLDDFKKVNDSLGHETGDQLLIEAGKRLCSVVSKGDTVGRLGGDEFIVLLDGLTDSREAEPVAERLLDQLRKPFLIDGRELTVGGTIGIAVYPEDCAEASGLLQSADMAMYSAKAKGRNTFSFFTHSMNKEMSRRVELEEQLRNGLERDEFSVVYQTQFDLNTGSIIGAEALLRWHNEALGEVSPFEFIPVAEQLGTIIPLGRFVLASALSQTASWRESNPGFRIAVNLSPAQFRDPNMVEDVREAIQQSGLPASSLELEITEGVLLGEHRATMMSLKRLSDMGVGIAMDDFGTGYSSLSYLRRFPFNVVKIDRSFVRDIATDPADRKLVSAAILLAHSLSLKVVAEGVETREQLDILSDLECDYAQGYFFSRPVAADKVVIESALEFA